MSAAPELGTAEALTDAVESGAGLPEVARAAARAIDASLVVLDRAGQVLAVAARSPAEEQSIVAAGPEIEILELRLGGEPVGELRLRARSEERSPLTSLVALVLAGELERSRAPQRASAEAAEGFVAALLTGTSPDPDEVGLELEAGAYILVARARSQAPVDDGWRARVLNIVDRGARAAASGAVSALSNRPGVPGAEVVVILPGGEEAIAARAADGMLRELEASLPGHFFSLGRSRGAGADELHRAAREAILAANVAEGDPETPVLAFDETGAYRLLLSQDPDELQRFYEETIAPLAAYDDQYETELVATVEAFLDADGNVAATSQRLFTHRHTVRYRLDRVRELTQLDVGSSDGREKLSLGLKAMRVLGIAAPGGPATEAGTAGGRVPRP
ncbi:MAG: PucR family transcriptional regulator [Solirubrobacteraceae bacterium]